MTRTLKPLILNTGALALTLILIYTGISAHDKLTWLMEVTPVIIVVPLLLATAKRYPLTPLLYTLIFFHAIILMVGGQYTYAKVPVGFEVQRWQWARERMIFSAPRATSGTRNPICSARCLAH
ncbi:MAG: DUF2238 domain-containing protein [Escherichia coli]|nr:DUF2238 domain-containing protein [Escherichia coli]